MDDSSMWTPRVGGISLIPSPPREPLFASSAGTALAAADFLLREESPRLFPPPPATEPLPSSAEVDLAWNEIMDDLHAFHRSARTHGASRVAPPRLVPSPPPPARPTPPPPLRSSLLVRSTGSAEEWRPLPSYHEMVQERLQLAQRKGAVQVQERWLEHLLARRGAGSRRAALHAWREACVAEQRLRRHTDRRRRRAALRWLDLLRRAARRARAVRARVARARAQLLLISWAAWHWRCAGTRLGRRAAAQRAAWHGAATLGAALDAWSQSAPAVFRARDGGRGWLALAVRLRGGQLIAGAVPAPGALLLRAVRAWAGRARQKVGLRRLRAVAEGAEAERAAREAWDAWGAAVLSARRARAVVLHLLARGGGDGGVAAAARAHAAAWGGRDMGPGAERERIRAIAAARALAAWRLAASLTTRLRRDVARALARAARRPLAEALECWADSAGASSARVRAGAGHLARCFGSRPALSLLCRGCTNRSVRPEFSLALNPGTDRFARPPTGQRVPARATSPPACHSEPPR